jgi:hypothetical protein
VREGDLQTAQGILDAVGVTLPTGRLDEGGYDAGGIMYRVPREVLSDPSNIEQDREDDREGGLEDADADALGETDTLEAAESRHEAKVSLDEEEAEREGVVVEGREKIDKGKAPLEKDAVKVKCRLSDRGGPDVLVAVGKGASVGVLVRRVRFEGEVSTAFAFVCPDAVEAGDGDDDGGNEAD